MVKRDVVIGEVVCVKISGKVVAALVLKGGKANISVRNLSTGMLAEVKTLKAIRAILKTV